jgi:hypothetical protein
MIKKITYSILFIISFYCKSQVGINTTSPDKSSVLDIESDKKGILIPKMNTEQRLMINSPANGLIVYDTDENTLCMYQTSKWGCAITAQKNLAKIELIGTANINLKDIDRNMDLALPIIPLPLTNNGELISYQNVDTGYDDTETIKFGLKEAISPEKYFVTANIESSDTDLISVYQSFAVNQIFNKTDSSFKIIVREFNNSLPDQNVKINLLLYKIVD